MQTFGYVAEEASAPLKLWEFERRAVRDNDVLIDILYCGICHSDIHQVRNEWGNAIFPMVPGHEIIGKISQVGSKVSKLKVGDIGGVGCMVDSCRQCNNCKNHEENMCEKGCALTYNSTEMDRKTPTYGGYSRQVVVDADFVIHVPNTFQKLEGAAPLLCAGITTYSPLRYWKSHVGPGKKVGINGLGGLGHMGVKFAVSFGAEVTVLSTSPAKEQDAKKLGAHHFVVSKDADAMKKVASSFDLILDTVSAEHDIGALLGTLKSHGVLAVVGVPSKPLAIPAFNIILGNKIVAGSGIGGIKETQEMIDYCAEKGIVSDIELISIDKVGEAYDRTVKGDIKYRFVIDISSIKK